MTALLAGRRGVVLGVSGTNSLGYAIAQATRELGAEVWVTCRPARLAAVAPLADAIGARCCPVEIDDEASLARMFAELADRGGALDFLVHSLVEVPAPLLARSLLEVPRADFARVVDVAAWSLVAACRHAQPLLTRSTAPRVVALTSACSHRMTPNYHVAGIAKAALEATVLYLAMQLGRDGVLVNAVSAGLIATDGAVRTIGARNAEATRAVQAKRNATGRAVTAAEVASCVAYLCSPLAQNVSGEIVNVDGGFSRAYL